MMLLQTCARAQIVRFVVVRDVTEAILPDLGDLGALAKAVGVWR